MKIICNDQNLVTVKSTLKEYLHFDLTIVEKGYQYEGLCYYFSMEHLDKLLDYLKGLENQWIIGYIKDVMYKINPRDIYYIEGFSNEAYLYTKDNQYKVNYKLYELEEKLSNYQFIRISKSCLVNISEMECVIPDIQRRYIIVLKDKTKLTLTRSYVKEFKDYLRRQRL